MVPSVPVTIERRWWQCAVGLLDMPVGLTLATRSVAGGTIRERKSAALLVGAGQWKRRGMSAMSSLGEDEQLAKKREPIMTMARAVA